jgi:hypothetical protein
MKAGLAFGPNMKKSHSLRGLLMAFALAVTAPLLVALAVFLWRTAEASRGPGSRPSSVATSCLFLDPDPIAGTAWIQAGWKIQNR